jgi:FkbM family methyltransferase
MRVLAPGDVVLEIGANIGYYVLLASSRCKHVYAVEPHPDNFDNLKHNLTLNGCTNVDAFQLALGDRRGTAKLNVSPNANWHSFHPVHSAARQIEVEMDTVDHFLANKPAPTFARMDVEGFELSVVRGMPNLLRTLKRLFLEIHADILALEETRELLDTLHAAGFRPELIAKYDRPGLAQSLPLNHLETIYRGDKGVYEVFFTRGTC